MRKFLIKGHQLLPMALCMVCSLSEVEATKREGEPIKPQNEQLKRPRIDSSSAFSLESESTSEEEALESWEELCHEIMHYPKDIPNTPELQNDILAYYFQGFASEKTRRLAALIPDLKDRALSDIKALWLLINAEVDESNDVSAETKGMIKALKERDDSDSLMVLGWYYQNALGFKENLQKSMQAFSLAADQGNARAQHYLGLSYYEGRGVDVDLEKAVHWIRKAADQGYAVAQVSLGKLYFQGVGVEQDVAKAVQWFGKAAEQGYAEAQHNLGVLYLDGNEVKQDLEKAAQWFLRAARQGDVLAQTELGNLYLQGQGVKKDAFEAVQWFGKAAEQGDAVAQFNLGRLYYRGDGVSRDSDQAIEWCRKAAEQGDAKAQNCLATIYSQGIDVNLDFVQAAQWLHKAADQGYAEAQHNLAHYYFSGTGVKEDRKTAFWYALLAKQGGFDSEMLIHLKEKYHLTFLRSTQQNEAEFIYAIEDSPLHAVEKLPLPLADTLENSRLNVFEQLSIGLAKLNRRVHGTASGDRDGSNPKLLPLFKPQNLPKLYDALNDINNILEDTLPQALLKPGFLITNLTFGRELHGSAENPYMRRFTIEGKEYLCLGEDNVSTAHDIFTLLSKTRKLVKTTARDIECAIMGFEGAAELKTHKQESEDTTNQELKVFYRETVRTIETLKVATLNSENFIKGVIRNSLLPRNKTFEQEFDGCFE